MKPTTGKLKKVKPAKQDVSIAELEYRNKLVSNPYIIAIKNTSSRPALNVELFNYDLKPSTQLIFSCPYPDVDYKQIIRTLSAENTPRIKIGLVRLMSSLVAKKDLKEQLNITLTYKQSDIGAYSCSSPKIFKYVRGQYLKNQVELKDANINFFNETQIIIPFVSPESTLTVCLYRFK